MIRIATEDDTDLVLGFAEKFAESLSYGKYATSSRLREIVEGFIKAPNDEKIVLIVQIDEGDVGFMAGMVNPFLLGDAKTAVEMGWWIEPNYRSLRLGSGLIEAFEFWAKKLDCKLITLICLDDRVGSIYENKGYMLTEQTYMKEVE